MHRCVRHKAWALEVKNTRRAIKIWPLDGLWESNGVFNFFSFDLQNVCLLCWQGPPDRQLWVPRGHEWAPFPVSDDTSIPIWVGPFSAAVFVWRQNWRFQIHKLITLLCQLTNCRRTFGLKCILFKKNVFSFPFFNLPLVKHLIETDKKTNIMKSKWVKIIVWHMPSGDQWHMLIFVRSIWAASTGLKWKIQVSENIHKTCPARY